MQSLQSEENYQKICDLVHDNYQTAARMQEVYGSEHMLQISEKKILSVIKSMLLMTGFKKFFVEDLLKRAKTTLK